MSFRYLEDIATADAAFEAEGNTVEELFLSAAQAVMGVMVERIDTIEPKVEVRFHLEEQELEMLLFSFLQEIIYYKDARRLLLLVDSVEIDQESSPITLSAVTWGETLDQVKHPLLTDVKAVTMHRFRVEKTGSLWKATVILDI
jgi:SHS2 domain-containing protein